jgi:hypothetical protein
MTCLVVAAELPGDCCEFFGFGSIYVGSKPGEFKPALG